MTQSPDRRTTIELRVRYAETDQMGVVYHANYLVWCEIGRTELIRERFASYAEVERAGVALAVSEATLRFHAAARYDDLIRVETWVTAVRSRAVSFEYLISRVSQSDNPERLASARTSLIALDRNSRPRKLPPELLARLRDD
jgi:acyl-CoA thioester hydrolase